LLCSIRFTHLTGHELGCRFADVKFMPPIGDAKWQKLGAQIFNSFLEDNNNEALRSVLRASVGPRIDVDDDDGANDDDDDDKGSAAARGKSPLVARSSVIASTERGAYATMPVPRAERARVRVELPESVAVVVDKFLHAFETIRFSPPVVLAVLHAHLLTFVTGRFVFECGTTTSDGARDAIRARQPVYRMCAACIPVQVTEFGQKGMFT
jgi:hypothetical protein